MRTHECPLNEDETLAVFNGDDVPIQCDCGKDTDNEKCVCGKFLVYRPWWSW